MPPLAWSAALCVQLQGDQQTIRCITLCRVDHHTHNLMAQTKSVDLVKAIRGGRLETNNSGCWSELWQKRYVSPALTGSPRAGYSSSGAGARRLYFAWQHLITLPRRCQGWRRSHVQYASLCHFVMLVYQRFSVDHKAASRWLGKLHRNGSGTLGWINFCALLN